MTVLGKEEDLIKFRDKASKSYKTFHKGVRTQNEDGTWTYDAEAVKEELHEAPISFMNFATPDDIEAYYGASDYKPEGYDEMSLDEKMAHAMKFSSDGWYDWNVREWGTKWDACNPEMTNDDPSTLSIGYRFDTAWSPAEGAFRKMVEQHPELGFEFHNEEEQGWGVEYEGTDGELSVVKEWDIPESHKDYEDLGQDCRGCENYADSEDQDDLYDDCPDNKKATEEAVQQMEDISELIG
jgi:hypothetical protein